jgi:hypothetical protein
MESVYMKKFDQNQYQPRQLSHLIIVLPIIWYKAHENPIYSTTDSQTTKNSGAATAPIPDAIIAEDIAVHKAVPSITPMLGWHKLSLFEKNHPAIPVL